MRTEFSSRNNSNLKNNKSNKSDFINKNFKGDTIIWTIVSLMFILGILVVYSSVSSLAYRTANNNAEHYLFRHSFFVLLSFVTMYITHRINHKYICAISKIGLYVSVILLLFVWKFGVMINEASRWLIIPFIHTSFQPSDFAQLCLLCYIANAFRFEDEEMLAERQKSVIVWVVLICGLIALTNFSRSILLFVSSVMMMFLGGYSFRKSLKNGILMLVVVCGAAFGFGQRGKTIVSRLKSFNQTELPCQTYQANIAIANGKLFGKGPGNSMQRDFLPYAYSDYIFPIIIEEYGFVGGIFTLILYLIVAFRGMKTLKDNRYTKLSKLLAVGLSFFIVIEAVINMGVAVGVLPSTGIPLPLISMGGTSSIFTAISFGIILNAITLPQKDFACRKNQFR